MELSKDEKEEFKILLSEQNKGKDVAETLLQISWIYHDPNAYLWKWFTRPPNRVYNIKLESGEVITLMTGKSLRKLCEEKGITINNYLFLSDIQFHNDIATLFGINIEQAKEICMNKYITKENGKIIMKNLNNPQPVGLQISTGLCIYERYTYMLLPICIRNKLVFIEMRPDESGVLLTLTVDEDEYALYALMFPVMD